MISQSCFLHSLLDRKKQRVGRKLPCRVQVSMACSHPILSACFFFSPGLPRVLLQVLQDPGWDHCCCHVPHLGGRSSLGQAHLCLLRGANGLEADFLLLIQVQARDQAQQRVFCSSANWSSSLFSKGDISVHVFGFCNFPTCRLLKAEDGKNSVYIPWERLTWLAGNGAFLMLPGMKGQG